MKKNLEKKGSILYSTKATNINDERVKYFENSVGSTHDKINSFTRYSSRQNIAKLIAQYKLIELSKDKLGDIIEAGVYFGSGLMGWASIATSLEHLIINVRFWALIRLKVRLEYQKLIS